MIEQWVIDRLNPLKGEKFVVLAALQRVIRAVDGWAKENVGRTGVRLCSVGRTGAGSVHVVFLEEGLLDRLNVPWSVVRCQLSVVSCRLSVVG